MNYSKLEKIGKVVDQASDDGDQQTLQEQIKYLQKCEGLIEGSLNKAYFYYLLANAWSGLRTSKHMQEQNNIWKLEQKEVFKEIYYLRKAILQDGFHELNLDLISSIYINLANCFDHYGRSINALKYYDKVLEIYPKHFMALANKALCLKNYSILDYDDSHMYLISRHAFFNYKKANDEIKNFLQTNSYDKQYYEDIQEIIQIDIEKLENYLTPEWLAENIDLNDYQLRNYKNERIYRKWALENKLFLNSMNDIGNNTIAAQDPLNLPNLFVKQLYFPKYITYFNQIKQEYITYRYLLFEGLNGHTKKFYEKDILITDDYDYNLYDINIEKIKIAFRGFYSIFDKIASFLNEYFELGLNEKQVDFRKIWYVNTKRQQKINPIFDKGENFALRGLYLISKDLYFNNEDEESKEFLEVLEPEAKEINKIRNHLEHKFIMIKMFDIEKMKEFSKRERCFYISEDELRSKTIQLAQLVRESIIYLSFAVHREERIKNNNETTLDIPLFSLKK